MGVVLVVLPATLPCGCVTPGFTVEAFEEERGLEICPGHTAGLRQSWDPTPGSFDWQNLDAFPCTTLPDLRSMAGFKPFYTSLIVCRLRNDCQSFLDTDGFPPSLARLH